LAQGGYLRLVTGRAWDKLSLRGYGLWLLPVVWPRRQGRGAAPEARTGNITVLGGAYAQINYARHQLKLGRQEYEQPWVNAQTTA